MNKIYLLLGSNMFDPEKQLKIAGREIAGSIGIIKKKSTIYKTAAWGITDQPYFLNQVLIVHSNLTAEETLEVILGIEIKMGRIRTTKNAPRIIDIDILFFNKEIINLKNLTIPHPAIQDRRFVLVPLNELSPRFIHPVLKKSIDNLLSVCPDNLDVVIADC